jgi:hypothetical protein
VPAVAASSAPSTTSASIGSSRRSSLPTLASVIPAETNACTEPSAPRIGATARTDGPSVPV